MPDRSPSPPLFDPRSPSPPPLDHSTPSIIHRRDKFFALPNFGPNSGTYSKFHKSNLQYDAVFGPQNESDMTDATKKFYQASTFEPARSPNRRQSDTPPPKTDYTLKKMSTCYPKVTKTLQTSKTTKTDSPEPFAFTSYELNSSCPSPAPKFKFQLKPNIATQISQIRRIKRLNLHQPNPYKSNAVHLLNGYTPKLHPTYNCNPDSPNTIKSTQLLVAPQKSDHWPTRTNLDQSNDL